MTAVARLRAALRRAAAVFASPAARRRADDELREELEAHLEMQIADNVARGMSPDEARRDALVSAGGLTVAVEAVRERREVPLLFDVGRDIRHAMREIVARPGFAVAVVLTLAIGIGANTAIFSVVDAVVLHPLPYPDPNRILSISETIDGEDAGVVDDAAYAAWSPSVRSMVLARYSGREGTVIRLPGGPREIRSTEVSLDYFRVLGLRPLIGRALSAIDSEPGAAPVLLLSEQVWRRDFAADPSVVGRTMNVDNQPTTIVGVMPASATSETGPQVWTPFLEQPARSASQPGVVYYWFVVARLRSGFTIEQARAELRALMPRASVIPHRGDVKPIVMTLADRRFGDQRKPVLLLFGAVVVLLLIACANLANLALVRAAGRRRELAVRLALGASAWRLARSLLTESIMLGVLGAAAGIVVAKVLLAYLIHLSPASVGNPERVRIDAVVLAFTMAITLGASLLFGIAPLVAGGRGDAARSLSSGTPRASAGRGQQTFRRILVVAQLATALVLLTGASLVARSFYRVTSIDLGFRPDHLIFVPVALPPSRYPDARVAPFIDELLGRIRHIHGVESASLGMPPLSGVSATYAWRDSLGHDRPPVDEIYAGRGYFTTIGARLVAGRVFDETDAPNAPPVAVVNEVLAHRLAPSAGAIGQIVPGLRATIIGIVGNVRPQVEAQAKPLVYQSLDQVGIRRYQYVMVRSNAAAGATELAIDQILHSMDPSLQPPRMQRMEDVVSEAIAPRQFVFVLLSLFAGVAALLAVIGLYGVLSRLVTERTREIGIRIALGAVPQRVIRGVLAQGGVLVFAGAVLGLGGSLAAVRVMRSLVYETSVYDPLAFGAATVLLVGVALVAAYLPARRATTVDPVAALRSD